VTAYNLRPELRLARLLAEEYGGEPHAMLGEFELAFVLFLLLSSLPAFEHWKAVLHLVRVTRGAPPVYPDSTERADAQVSMCDENAGAWPQLALGVVSALTQQLALTPEDMFHDAMTSDNFMRPALASLARSSTAPSSPSGLRDAGAQLREFVCSRFAVHLSPSASAESLEDAPAVVEGDEAASALEAEPSVIFVAGAAADTCVLPSGTVVRTAELQRMDWMLPAPATAAPSGDSMPS
jgi:hypothetical protein